MEGSCQKCDHRSCRTMRKFEQNQARDEKIHQANPPCPKCGMKKTVQLQYGFKDRDWEYVCENKQCNHHWELV